MPFFHSRLYLHVWIWFSFWFKFRAPSLDFFTEFFPFHMFLRKKPKKQKSVERQSTEYDCLWSSFKNSFSEAYYYSVSNALYNWLTISWVARYKPIRTKIVGPLFLQPVRSWSTDCIFSRAWLWLHVFPRLQLVACFPALGLGSFPLLQIRRCCEKQLQYSVLLVASCGNVCGKMKDLAVVEYVKLGNRPTCTLSK